MMTEKLGNTSGWHQRAETAPSGGRRTFLKVVHRRDGQERANQRNSRKFVFNAVMLRRTSNWGGAPVGCQFVRSETLARRKDTENDV